MSVLSYVETANMEAADTNNDGVLWSAEFNDLTREQRLQIRQDLWEQNWNAFVEARAIRFEQKQEETQSIANESITARDQLHSELQESTEVSSEFTRTLRRWAKGPDVALLQQKLTEAWFDARYNGRYDGDFWSGTQRALMNYQRQVLGQSWDGVMDLWGATMNSFLQNQNTETDSPNDSSRRTITKFPYSIGVNR